MRLFVALELPWTLRERLAALAGAGLPGARWVPPENYHLTLRFIGETPGHRAEDIDVALAGLRARRFTLTMAGLGTFTKGGRSTALWVGVERNPQLEHLQSKIETALQRCGLDPERRRFQPHVTLARLDNVPEGKAGFIRPGAQPVPRRTGDRWSISRLFSSRLGKEASVYTPKWNTAWAEAAGPIQSEKGDAAVTAGCHCGESSDNTIPTRFLLGVRGPVAGQPGADYGTSALRRSGQILASVAILDRTNRHSPPRRRP